MHWKGLMVFLLFIFFLVPYNIKAQTHTRSIISKIYTSDRKAAALVTVQITGTKRTTTTNEEGSFSFKNIQPGTYELVVTLVDYETATQQVTVESNATASVE